MAGIKQKHKKTLKLKFDKRSCQNDDNCYNNIILGIQRWKIAIVIIAIIKNDNYNNNINNNNNNNISTNYSNNI